MMRAALLVLVTTMVLTPVPAVAQTAASSPDVAPRWTIALGGASMHPLHGDEEDEGPVVIGAVGYGLSRHLRVEGEFTWRTATRSYVQTGGPGVVWHREDDRRYRTVTNCTPPIPGNGFECRSFDDTTAAYGAGLQLMAGLDLTLHRRVTLFVAGRGEYRQDLSMGGFGVMAGARIGLR